MVSEKQRGAATSIYQTSWDLGIGIGIFAGTAVSGWSGDLSIAYFYRALLAGVSILIFRLRNEEMPQK